MKKTEITERYLVSVGEQIEWRRAKKPVLDELETHIADSYEANVNNGMTEAEAEKKAVDAMGDPVETGKMLNGVHRPHPDYPLMTCMLSLSLTGTALMYMTAGAGKGNRMLLLALCSVLTFCAGYFLDVAKLARKAELIFLLLWSGCFFGSFLAGAYTSAAQLGYALPLAFGLLLYRASQRSKRMIIICLAFMMCVLQGFYSKAGFGSYIYLLICCCGIVLYALKLGLIAEKKHRVVLYVFIPVIASLVLSVFLYQFAGERIKGALDPYSDPYAFGYLSMLAREMVYSSNFIGEGGQGAYDLVSGMSANTSELFESEFMLAFAAHRFGWIVLLSVAVLVLLAFFLLAKGIRRQSGKLGKLTAFSVTMCFAFRTVQYFICNLGVVIFSTDGLPLFSLSGKLMLIDAFMAGLLLSVFRMESITRDSIFKTEKV